MATRKGVRVGEAVDEYLKFKGRRVSPNTLRAHRYLLKSMTVALKNRLIANVTAEHVEDFFFGMDVEPATLGQHRSRLRSFWGWARDKGYIEINPTLDIDKIKTPKKNRKRLSAELLIEMMESAPDPRDRAFLAAVQNTALRSNEITRWVWGDVDLEYGAVDVIISKTGDADEMKVTADLDVELRRWKQVYEAEIGRPVRKDDYVFPSWYSRFAPGGKGTIKELTPNRRLTNAELVIHRGLERIGVEYEKGDGVHLIRRSVARLYFDMVAEEKGDVAALRETSDLLHHAHSSTTEIYLGTSTERSRRDRRMHGKPFLSAMVAAKADEDDNVISLRKAN